MGAASSERPEETSPIRATTLLREISFLAAVADSPALVWLSSYASSSGRPSTPPAALISSIAITIPWWEVWPKPASLPVSEAYSPTLIGSAATAVLARRARAAKRSGVFMGKEWSGIHVLHKGKPSLLYGQDDGGLGWVALGIEGDQAGGAAEILGGGEGVPQFRALGGTGPADGVDQDHGGIVAQGRERVGIDAPASAEPGVEIRHLGRLVFGRVMGGEVGTLDRRAADGDEFGGFPAVDAHEGDGQAEVAGLAGDQSGFGVVARHKDALDAGRLDGGKLGAEVLVALAVLLFGRNGAAVGGKAFAEIFRETDALGGGDGRENGDAVELQRFAGEFRHHGALELVDETNPEDVVAARRDLRGGGAGGDQRDPGVLADGRGLEGAAGRDFAEDGDDLVAGDELFDDRGGLARLGLVVLGEQLELAAEDAAGGVDLLDGEQRALVGILTVGGFLAGEGGEFPDFDRFLGGEAAETEDETEGQNKAGQGTGGHEGDDGAGDVSGGRGGFQPATEGKRVRRGGSKSCSGGRRLLVIGWRLLGL